MRKLKLQTQVTLDGFAAGPNGELDWMEWNWDDEIKKYVSELTGSIDCILLGRKMTEGFMSYWTKAVENPNNPEFPFAKIMYDTRKIVFTKTLDQIDPEWNNTSLAKGNLAEEITQLKKQTGKDIIAYGGAGFVSNLIKHGLIDEYYLFINPTAIGNGLTIFRAVEQKLKMKLIESRAFSCGIVLHHYQPQLNKN